jgi:hypothetical protein
MVPFLRDGDVVDLEPIRTPLRAGDIALVRSEGDRYLLHRVRRADGDTIVLRGDARRREEGPFSRRDVLGRVIIAYRDGSVRVMDGGFWHVAGRTWARSAGFGWWLRAVVRWVRSAVCRL